MGKPQKKPQKKNLSLADKVRKTKTSTQIKNNPFEVKINRKKFDVLGRKTKHDVGLPGVSRSKAINKRKETLLKEYKSKNKSNKFVDKRFGEYDSKMEPEEKILQRFALERQRTHEKKDIYNLNEEEELTHYGQSLAEMEKFTHVGDSDDEPEERGTLSAELTASHFGGGGGLLRKKTPGEQEEEGGSLKPKSRQELIEELIQKSKQEKRERQVQKEEAHELTEKLDQEWQSIRSLLAHKNPSKGGGGDSSDRQEDKPKLDEYDMRVRELAFEMKAQPSEKLKTPEELAMETKERLQRLEADRQRRMLGDAVQDRTQTQTHISADDLNDGFILDKDDRKTLSYQDGKWNVEEESGDAGDEEEEEDDDGEEGGSEEGEEGSEAGDEDVDEEEEEEDDEEEGEEEEDSHSDLDSEKESGGEEEEKEEEPQSDVIALTEEEKKSRQEAAMAELPYTFTAPEKYSELKSLLQGHSPDNQVIILARMQKCNHPSLAAGNKLKLQKLVGFLLDYVGELATRNPPELVTIDKIIPQLYALSQMFPDASCQAMQAILAGGAKTMEEALSAKGHAPFPSLDMVIYVKVTALLFPTSDFRHPATTPALLYTTQALSKCPVRSLQDVTSGLALCCLALEYVSLSKRFLPELINFLCGTLHLAVPDKTSIGSSVVPPFRPSRSGRSSELLVLSDPLSCHSWTKSQMSLSAVQHLDFQDDTHRDHHRLTCLSTCLDLVKRSCLLYKSLLSFRHIFQTIETLLSKHLPVKTYPTLLQELTQEILEAISGAPSLLTPLVFEKKKPIPMKMFTPKIVEILDYGKKRGSNREERERERLKHKYKKEFKGALREVRKDSRFLAREKLNEIKSRDAERKRKVKELFGSLATQEGEWKALKRKKRKL